MHVDVGDNLLTAAGVAALLESPGVATLDCRRNALEPGAGAVLARALARSGVEKLGLAGPPPERRSRPAPALSLPAPALSLPAALSSSSRGRHANAAKIS